MTLALFDIFTQIESYNDAINQVCYSIQRHLIYLLNARQGSLVHLPDYGLPDIAEIYQGLPQSLAKLISNIERTILKYEPRLKNPSVIQQNIKGQDSILHLQITGKYTMHTILAFDTYFTTHGVAKIYPSNHSQ